MMVQVSRRFVHYKENNGFESLLRAGKFYFFIKYKIHDYTKKLSKSHELEAADEAVVKFLGSKSAEGILKDLEKSRKQAEAGEYSSAEEVFNELEQRYGF